MNILGRQVAEISTSLREGRYTVCARRADVAALALIVAKEEEFVFLDRPAERAAKFVPVAAGKAILHALARSFTSGLHTGRWSCLGRALCEWVSGEIRVRALEIKRRPVKFICAGLGL